MALTETIVKRAKAKGRDYKISDGAGLYLLIKTTGSKYWRFKYRLDGKEKLASFGVYPRTGLKEAREMRDKYRKELFELKLRMRMAGEYNEAMNTFLKRERLKWKN
jgi:hypothetical protein